MKETIPPLALVPRGNEPAAAPAPPPSTTGPTDLVPGESRGHPPLPSAHARTIELFHGVIRHADSTDRNAAIADLCRRLAGAEALLRDAAKIDAVWEAQVREVLG